MTGDASYHSKATQFSVPDIGLPKGGGALRGIGETFQPEPFTGAANYSITFPLTGARGFEPALSIDYSSGNGNDIFGMGFTLSLPSISVLTGKGIPRYNGTDIYLCNGDELVLKDQAFQNAGKGWTVVEYLPRVQSAFSLIQHFVADDGAASYWKVTDNDHTVSLFGYSNASRIYNPASPAEIAEWLIERSTDAKGNKIEYDYKAEDGEGTSGQTWEKDHSYTNKYISHIRYGNYADPMGKENFAYEVIFDYGEYVLSANPHAPVNKWNYRPDPFSSYTTGFEIRTCRLCRNILLFHFFEDKLGDTCLVKSLRFEYEQSNAYGDADHPGLSIMSKATLSGYRREGTTATDEYAIQQMPPAEFTFSSFDPPAAPHFQLLKIDKEDIPGYLNNSSFQPIDLTGEGIAGLLYTDESSLYYYAPEGDGEYAPPGSPLHFPTDHNFASGNSLLTDLDGNGALDIVVKDRQRQGYYLNDTDGGWRNFTPFQSVPTTISSPGIEFAGLNNNGKTDAILVGASHITIYPSLGTDGYGLPVIVQKQIDFPSAKKDYEKEYVGFADMMGDGLPHRVRISNGSVECWPDMGYGLFGEKITLGNAPWFGSDFDSTRVFLADIDGSGTSDIVYAYHDRITVHINQSGNYFSDAITIFLLEPYSFIDQIGFSDIKGNGTNCLIYSKAGETFRHYFYDFVGETNAEGLQATVMKPYLLIEIDNNMGIANQVQYCSSTKFYLEDQKSGDPWCTRLPFPVQVVERLHVIDQVNEARYTNSYKYHDGYYAPGEKAFMGFGYVETWDTETYAGITGGPAVQSIKKENYVPPVHSKTWYHTGAGFDDPDIMTNYKAHFFKGDPDAYAFPDTLFEKKIYSQDSDTLRQAYVALKGQIIRTEVYADDKETNPTLYQNPYTVTASNSEVILFQEKGDRLYAVFLVVGRESISYNYERHPADPRVQQTFTLQTDNFGNTVESCFVYLSRRPNNSADFVNYPEQYTVRGSLTFQRYVNIVNGFLFCHIPCEEQHFELAGIQPDKGYYFSFDGIKKQVDSIGLPDRSEIIPYAGPFTSGVQARQISWNRQYFWDWADKDQIPSLGMISSPALSHHSEEAFFTKEFPVDVYSGKLIDDAAYKNDGYLSNVIFTHGGYFYNSSDGYWWNKGLVQYYLSPTMVLNGPVCYYQPWKTENRFAAEPVSTPGNPVAEFYQDPSLKKCTSVLYDEYYLFPVKRIEEVAERTTNAVSAIIDYISALPSQLTDVNNNITQVLYDPLGQVTVSSLIGSENGVRAGGMTLYPDGPATAEYKDPGAASFDDVIDDPHRFLQGAGTYYYYNVKAWIDSKQPVCSISLTRDHYWSSPDADDDPYCQFLISYTDGLGRDIENKTKCPPHNSPNDPIVYNQWKVTGRTVYNNKEKPCEQFLPYFSLTAFYEDQQHVPGPPPTVIHYDPLSRVIRTDTPKGFFSKVEFTPWEELHYDEDDTMLDSAFYKNKYPGNLTPYEIDAIKKTIRFYNTPAMTIVDNKGDAFLQIKNNLGNIPKDLFTSIEQKLLITSEGIWDSLYSNGYLLTNTDHPKIELTFLTAKFQPYTKGFTLHIDPKYDGVLQKIVDILKANCQTSFFETDVSGRILTAVDPRIYYNTISNNATGYNFRYKYAMGGKDPVYIDSVDAGAQNPIIDSWAETHLPNIFGSQLWTWSPRSYCQLICYDRLQRKTALKVKKITAAGPVHDYNDFNAVELLIYGESHIDPLGYNLRGQLYRINDLSGIAINPSYTMLGQPLVTTRQMLEEYTTAADWRDMLPLVEQRVYKTSFTYNAVQQMLTQTTPDGAITSNAYDLAGQLRSITTKFPDTSPDQTIIEHIEYDANGQRTRLKYGNGIVTKYKYETTTLRLIRAKSVRPVSGDNNTQVQDIDYYYDPVGNITSIYDNASEIIFCRNQRIDPLSDYTYNAIYQLVTAKGRQHTGININTYKNNSPDSFKQCYFGPPPSVADSDKLENYTENFSYDDSGNLVAIGHIASVNTSWTRVLPVEDNSNRLKNRDYDASGNLRKLDISNDVDLSYNCCESLVKAGIIKRPNEKDDCDYYMYDSQDRRTRKVSEKMAQGGTLTLVEDKLYFGNFEIKRNIDIRADGTTAIQSERYTLRVMDDQRCVAIVYYTKTDTSHPDMEGLRQCRFQMDNNIGSVSMEMDAAARLISYEEYFPYGGTSIITGQNKTEVKWKEYRYSGKECDDSTGLYYYGARYYVSWQGRWLNPDPAGTIDGMNLFAFVGGNPITHADINGTMKRSRRGTDPEYEGLKDSASKRRTGDMLGMRATPADPLAPTAGYTPVDKSFKSSIKIHWKGTKDPLGLTTGIDPDITTRDSKVWAKEHEMVKAKLDARLSATPGFTRLDNGSSYWAAENSHIIAGSLWGANDVLSAPPASVHQNTEWLAIETGIKSLINNSQLGGDLRLKATGYVDPATGFLKSSRYKIYIGGTKVFDHVSLGTRGNIDIDEAKALKTRVKSLTAASPQVSFLGKAPKPLSTLDAPSVADMSSHRTASAESPMFTGLKDGPKYYKEQDAFQKMTSRYQKWSTLSS